MADEAVLRELEQVRGELGRISGMAGQISTSCAVLISRSDRTERDVRELRDDAERDARELRDDMEGAVEALQQEIKKIKERQWPLPVVTVLVALVGTAVALASYFR
jgi:hypothetical protein